MAKSVSEISRFLDSRAPVAAAEKWDNVGLLCGDPDWKTEGAVLSVDLSREAIDLAVKKKFRLIITHHPCLFPRAGGITRVVREKKPGVAGLVFEALRKGVAVIASHTNFDVCALEAPLAVAEGLGFSTEGRLLDHSELRKLVVYVPAEYLEPVREAICAAGAGQIGAYDTCTFSSPGEGTFRGNESTHPFLGKPGILEKAQEFRLETIFPKGLEASVLGAMRAAHPYEEIAYDLYPVDQRPSPKGFARGIGYGVWGNFARAKSFSELARDVKSLFKIDGFWMTDPHPSRYKRVAFVAGKGASFVSAAISAGCDLFITGEAGYHVALDASRRGMTVMELGHTESERFFIPTLKTWLTEFKVKAVDATLRTQRIIF